MSGELGVLDAHPGQEGLDEIDAAPLPRTQALRRAQADDFSLDVEHRVDAFDGLQSELIGECRGKPSVRPRSVDESGLQSRRSDSLRVCPTQPNHCLPTSPPRMR